jgi:altronate dehydratase
VRRLRRLQRHHRKPLLGRLADRLTAIGGRVVLTEVPEMFGGRAGS